MNDDGTTAHALQQQRLEWLARYIIALERGDSTQLEVVLRQAEHDARLELLLLEANTTYNESSLDEAARAVTPSEASAAWLNVIALPAVAEALQALQEDVAPMDQQTVPTTNTTQFAPGGTSHEHDGLRTYTVPAPTTETATPPFASTPRIPRPMTRWQRHLHVLQSAAAVILVIGVLGSFVALFSVWRFRPISTPPLVTQMGPLRCSVSTLQDVTEFGSQPLLSWSARGEIATSFPLETFSASTCTSRRLGDVPDGTFVMPMWSPDGKRLLLVGGNTAQIFDATTGRLLVHWQTSIPSEQFGSVVWADHGTQIVAAIFVPSSSGWTATMRIQAWDAATGTPISTAFSTRAFDVPLLKGWNANGAWFVVATWISPNGTYFAEQTLDFQVKFWKIATGQLVSTTSGISYGVGVNPQLKAWSPDGAYLAVALNNSDPSGPAQVQIWSTMTGKLVTTVADTHAFAGEVGGVAWSPNGDYLAESSGQINIWNTTTWHLAATFGKISVARPAGGEGNSTALQYEIGAITWSPDGRMLASVCLLLLGENQRVTGVPLYVETGVRDTLSVWSFA